MIASTRRRLATMRRLFPLRPAGVVLLGVGLEVVFRLSQAEADYVLYPAGLVVIGLVALCALLVIGGAVTLGRRARRLEAKVPERLETTHEVLTGFRIQGLARWLILDVRLEWVSPASTHVRLLRSDGFLEERVTPLARGRFEALVRRFTVEDVFGLAQVAFSVEWQTSLSIVPAAAAHVAEMLPSRASGDAVAHPSGREEGDLVEMRNYAQGDSLRHVLWKTYARTRRLLVRMPERAIAQRPLNVALFVAGPRDEPSAGAARLYVEKGLLGPDFIFAADGASRPTRSAVEAVEQLVDSVKAQGDGGATLEALVQQIEPARLTAFLVFAPPADGPWRQRLLGLVRQRGVTATVVIGVDHLIDVDAEAQAKGRLHRLVFQDDGAGASDAGLLALRDALEADGHTVRLVHRPSGQTW